MSLVLVLFERLHTQGGLDATQRGAGGLLQAKSFREQGYTLLFDWIGVKELTLWYLN